MSKFLDINGLTKFKSKFKEELTNTLKQDAGYSSYIPPTKFKISKDMTQKEAYQIMKEAGIVEGTYSTTEIMKKTFTDGVTLPKTGSSYLNRGASASRTGNGFSCFDYDLSKIMMNIPIITNFLCTLPIDDEIFIGITGDKADTSVIYENTKAYICKTSDILNIDTNNASSYLLSNPISTDVWAPYLVALHSESESSSSSNKIYYTRLMALVADGKILAMQSDGKCKMFSINKETMSLVDEGYIDLIEGLYFTRWIYPAFYAHNMGEWWELPVWDDTDKKSELKNYQILKTTDFKNFESLESIESPNIWPMDIVRCNGRIFVQGLNSSSTANTDGSYNTIYAFYEYLPDSKTLIPIPNEYNKLDIGKDQIEAPAPLIIKDNVIYGTISGGDFFSYDTTTNEFTNLSDEIFESCLIEYFYGYNGRGNITPFAAAPKRFSITEILADGTTKKTRYGKSNSWFDSFLITSCGWSDSLGGVVISVCLKSTCVSDNTAFISTVVYNPTQGRAQLLPPTVSTYGVEFKDIVCTNTPLAEKDGEYLIGGNSFIVLASNIDTTNLPAFDLGNPTEEELISACNKYDDATDAFREVFHYPYDKDYKGSMPLTALYMETALKNCISMGEEMFTTYPITDGDRMHRFDDTTIHFNCPFPLTGVDKMYVRDKGDRYEILCQRALSPFFNLIYEYISFFKTYEALILSLNGIGDIIPNENVLPILTIKKDSDETVGATFYWDFPAQLTVPENVRTVSPNKAFLYNIFTN